MAGGSGLLHRSNIYEWASGDDRIKAYKCEQGQFDPIRQAEYKIECVREGLLQLACYQ